MAARTTKSNDVEPKAGTARTHLELKRQELVTEIDNLVGAVRTHRQHADEADGLLVERKGQLADVDDALKVLQEHQ